MLSWQLRTPGSGTVRVTTPIPEKAPAGIFTVQSPFLKSPPTSPFTDPETIWEVEESDSEIRSELDVDGSAENPWAWPEGCFGERGEDEHPVRMRSIATVGSVLMRDPRIDLKWVPPRLGISYVVDPRDLSAAMRGRVR